jgi:hypothetical protein
MHTLVVVPDVRGHKKIKPIYDEDKFKCNN